MSNTTQLPLNLYKANLELQTRIAKLIQEGGRQWLELGQRAIEDGIAECDAEVEEVLKAGDWQALATLPAESFWRQVQQRFGDSQAAVQIAVGAQTAFASGLQDAVRTWQKETALAPGDNPLAASFEGSPWADLLKPWQQLLSPSASAAPSPAAKQGARTGGGKRG